MRSTLRSRVTLKSGWSKHGIASVPIVLYCCGHLGQALGTIQCPMFRTDGVVGCAVAARWKRVSNSRMNVVISVSGDLGKGRGGTRCVRLDDA